MLFATVDYVPIVIATVVQFVISAVIYGPVLGKPWMDAMSTDKGSSNWMQSTAYNVPGMLMSEVVFNFARAYVIAMVMAPMKIYTLSEANLLAFYLFGGFMLTNVISAANWEARPAAIPVIRCVQLYLATLSCCLICASWPAY